MTKNQSEQPLQGALATGSLTKVLGQSERVEDIVVECADDLSTVNTGLKHELQDKDVSPGVETALDKSEAVANKVLDASEELALVNLALKEQITERQILDARLAAVTQQADDARHASLHDSLTGLPNRALFNDRLEHGLAAANRSGLHFAVMFLDLDDFKTINDSYGHDVGDLVLKTIAARLREVTRDDDTVSRYGGDEFLYILANIASENDIGTVAQKIIDAVQAPCEMRVRNVAIKLSVNPSIGISIFPKHGTTSDVLLDLADKAMYRAKHNKSGYSFADGDQV